MHDYVLENNSLYFTHNLFYYIFINNLDFSYKFCILKMNNAMILFSKVEWPALIPVFRYNGM